jgi:hemolysin activation/secretion protein
VIRTNKTHGTDVTNITGNASAMNAMQMQRRNSGGTRAARLTSVAAALVAVLGLTAGTVSAQVAPDAGRVLQDTMPTEAGPLSPSARIELEAGALEDMEGGGATVRIASVRITGNTVYSETELLAVLGNVGGRDYDLAGLRSLANQISRHYRASGYPFAHAYLPEQDVSAGQLRIDVIEGRYGEVRTSGNARVAAPAQRYLRPLQGGERDQHIAAGTHHTAAR